LFLIPPLPSQADWFRFLSWKNEPGVVAIGSCSRLPSDPRRFLRSYFAGLAFSNFFVVLKNATL